MPYSVVLLGNKGSSPAEKKIRRPNLRGYCFNNISVLSTNSTQSTFVRCDIVVIQFIRTVHMLYFGWLIKYMLFNVRSRFFRWYCRWRSAKYRAFSRHKHHQMRRNASVLALSITCAPFSCLLRHAGGIVDLIYTGSPKNIIIWFTIKSCSHESLEHIYITISLQPLWEIQFFLGFNESFSNISVNIWSCVSICFYSQNTAPLHSAYKQYWRDQERSRSVFKICYLLHVQW
jgi:hypothetical protein